jgi:hypothetical protein
MTTWRSPEKVKAACVIRSLAGIVLRETAGTVLYRIDRLGDEMLVVEFENGETTAVYPQEIVAGNQAA